MNLTGQKNRNRAHFLWLLLIIFTVSCSASELPASTSVERSPTAQAEPPVEYGASLSEWDEAIQNEPEETDVPENNNSGIVEAQATATLTVTPTDLVDAVSSTEMDSSTSSAEATTPNLFTFNDITYQEIMWEALIPADFTPDAIMAKYADQLAQFDDGSPEAYELYTQMQTEFDNAPVNELIDGTLVRLPGFIAPLEYTNDQITEFLLVPYFGACIHVPPPPANQTVLVITAEGHGINSDDSYNPVWVMGELKAEGNTTDLAQAGYFIANAIIEPY